MPEAHETHWPDEVAVIGGAAGAMGGAVVRALLDRGARVVGLDKEAALSANPIESDRYTGVPVDLASRTSIVEAFAKIDETVGVPTMAANYAAISNPSRYVADATEDEWNSVLGLNLAGTFWFCQQALGRMMPAKRGSILVISSLNGFRARQSHNTHVYAISKAGLSGLTRTLAAEAGNAGVRVNCIAPGLHKTLMWKVGGTQEKFDRYVEQWVENTPLHKIGEPEDMVGPSLFFLSSASSYMTGQLVFQDGGKSIMF